MSQLRIAGALTAALEAVVAVIPGLVVGECWLKSRETGVWDDLVSFYTPTPLIAHAASASAAATVVDLATAKRFANHHSLSLKLAARVASSTLLEWTYDLSSDELLNKLTFTIETALGVPVLGKNEQGRTVCVAVLVLYSSQREEVSRTAHPELIRCLQHAGH